MSLAVEFLIERFDGEQVPCLSSGPISANGVIYHNLGLLFAGLHLSDEFDRFSTMLDERHFEYWWNDSRAGSDDTDPELVRLYPLLDSDDPDDHVTIPRDLLRRILVDWKRFLADGQETTRRYPT